ncbi:ATPase [Qipengyuania atrilutea]|uniref:ATPase n=1 Tax=Qipengyuania atrilutea TaxID=2744473 RepID=A0A850GZQ1_9SPHN|nr:ATPase [Actirhodobacter atriluteus]NVD43877.1 ATPase [Actirhodobacter atriluteus]
MRDESSTEKSSETAAPDSEAPLELERDQAIEEPASGDFIETEQVYDAPAEAEGRSWKHLPVVAAVTLALAWTAFFAFANQNAILFAGASSLSTLVSLWAAPVLLIAVVYLIAMRSSTREAGRFGDAANLLASESAALEERLLTINRELSLAREFLATQSRELEFLGRGASEKISGHAKRLEDLIGDNVKQLETVSEVSDAAVRNMDKLRSDLPVIANSARDVSNQIGGAGRGAQTQVELLISGFERLNKFGLASERQVTALETKVREALSGIREQSDQLGALAENRFDALRGTIDGFRADLDSSEIEALTGIRQRAEKMNEELEALRAEAAAAEGKGLSALVQRIERVRDSARETSDLIVANEKSALENWSARLEEISDQVGKTGERFDALDAKANENAQRRAAAIDGLLRRIDEDAGARAEAFDETLAGRKQSLIDFGKDAGEALSAHLIEFDDALTGRREQHEQSTSALAADLDNLAQRVDQIGERIEGLAALGKDAQANLAEDLSALGENFEKSRALVTDTEGAIESVTNSSVRLLELIQASAKHGREVLPASLRETEAQLDAYTARAEALRDLLANAETSSAALSEHLDGANEYGTNAARAIDALEEKLAGFGISGDERIAALKAELDALADKARATEAETRASLERASEQLRGALSAAVEGLETGDDTRLDAFAEEVGKRSADKIDEVVRSQTLASIGELENSAQKAADRGQKAASLLRDQLARINELTGNLEARIEKLQEQSEDRIDHDFSRRVAVITENLHSSAVDISKALSEDVSETAWAAYLRGDRGIFTRKAVRLLDQSEAREIAEMYANDGEFRENVSRYIHDFEGMLRTLLSTRDGNALSVTVLSSDMGKLYVALAQAIERLRS